MKRWQLRAVLLLTALGLCGLLVMVSGIIPISASSGHWAITAWFLDFGKQRSVATHALALEPLALDEPWLVMKGAGHYETGCRPCHGSPELRHPRVARAMTPPPPYLPPRISRWEPKELFYMVKHGIKFTGMPAWPSQQRDDEVRAMVAFLLKFPELDAEGYRQLVYGATGSDLPGAPLPDLAGDSSVPRAAAASCARCHGKDGQGRGTAAFPKLAGQPREYLMAALSAFARDERHSGIMQPIAAGLTPAEMRELADYYSALATDAGHAQAARPPAAVLARGREIASRGVPNQRVPSCTDCHGPDGRRRKPAYPLLAGQFADYLVLQLELFKLRRRGGSSYAHLMNPVVARLSAQQMRDVAAYYASLPSGPRAEKQPEPDVR
jgi:cytochrome c553